MKLIKRALIAFALVRIAQNVAFAFQVTKLEQALNDKESELNKPHRGQYLKSALEMWKGDLKEVQIHKAQALVSKAELRKEMIDNYV